MEPIFGFVFTEHALLEMARRGVSQEQVSSILADPEQTEMVREGRAVYQANMMLVKHEKPMCYEFLWISTVNHLGWLLFIERVRLKSIGDKL